MKDRLDTYLQGASYDGYTVFGAHFAHENGESGVRFTVYAPHAQSVELVGDFNDWIGWRMERNANGVWSIFARNLAQGMLYKYRIHAANTIVDRADPFAFYAEKRPDTASVIWGISHYVWQDEVYLRSRSKNFDRPMSIYELHVGSWKQHADGSFYGYKELAEELIPYLLKMGYTHIECMPLTEHPFDGSWGYQTSGYFAATSRYGTPNELMAFIDHCHQAGIGCILDFVPLHFVTDMHALQAFDGSYLYESDDESARYTEWGTLLFDYTKPHVLSFMKSALDFWIRQYHMDGIRFDAVSGLIYRGGDPARGVNDAGVWFLKNANFTLSQAWPDVMLIAEDSSIYPKVTAPVPYGGLGFDYKWDLGFMNDTLRYLSSEHRESDRISASTEYFYQEKYILPFSHDEVVHCKRTLLEKMPGSRAEQFAQLRTLFLYSFTHPGKKLNFMGNDFAVNHEWNEVNELDWDLLHQHEHAGFQRYFAALNGLYLSHSALFTMDLHPAAFCWRRADHGVFVYERNDLHGQCLLIALNFSPHTQHTSLQAGAWCIVLSSDEATYGGNATLSLAPDGKSVILPPYCGCVLEE